MDITHNNPISSFKDIGVFYFGGKVAGIGKGSLILRCNLALEGVNEQLVIALSFTELPPPARQCLSERNRSDSLNSNKVIQHNRLCIIALAGGDGKKGAKDPSPIGNQGFVLKLCCFHLGNISGPD